MVELLVGFVVRLAQVGIEAAPTLVIGVFTAGIFRRMVGPAGARRLFGSGVRGLITGWIAGKLLPVCSLGVIPVARELRRSGVPGGTVLSFVLAAPLLNPLSLLYGITLSKPAVILSFAGCSLLLSTLAGWLWDRVFARTSDAIESARLADLTDLEPLPPPGPRRLLAVFVSGVKELTGRDLLFYAIGLAASALLSTLIPFGSLQRSMMPDDSTSPLLMAAVAIPLFTSPLQGMMKIGMMFGHGNSVGAALILFLLGIGTSGGTVAWLAAEYGWRRVLPWLAVFFAVVIGLGYAAQWLLTDRDHTPADHTHAFDDYCCPFPVSSGSDVFANGWMKVAEKFGPFDRPPVYALGALIAAGLVVRRWDRDGRVERWLAAPSTERTRTRPKWDVTVPPAVVGAVAILGLLAFSVVGAYAYYPDRKQCLTEMTALNAEAAVAVNTNKPADATRNLEEWDLVSRKLEVGVFLRTWQKTPEQGEAGKRLRDALEEVRDALREGHPDKAKLLYKLRSDQMQVRDAVKAGDLATARQVIAEAEAKRQATDTEQMGGRMVVIGVAATGARPSRSLVDELGTLADAILHDDLSAAQAALADLGYADTVSEAYDVFKQAFPER